VRLRELNTLYEKAKEEEQLQEAARMLKQAAKEVGEKFTNETQLQHSGEMEIRGVDFSPPDEDNA
jgi:hypothetical protein